MNEALVTSERVYLAKQFKQKVLKYNFVKFEYSKIKTETRTNFKMSLHKQKLKLDRRNNIVHLSYDKCMLTLETGGIAM